MYLKLALAIVTAYRLQGQQSHNAPDLVIAEYKQRAHELTSMLPSDIQPLVSVCLQQAKKWEFLSAQDVLDISRSLALPHIEPTVLALWYDQPSANDTRFTQPQTAQL